MTDQETRAAAPEDTSSDPLDAQAVESAPAEPATQVDPSPVADLESGAVPVSRPGGGATDLADTDAADAEVNASDEDDRDDDDTDDDDTDEDDTDDTDDDDDADHDGGDAAGVSSGAVRGERRLSKERAAALEREGEVAADFLERLLDIADLDGDIDVDVDGDRAAVAIVDSEDGRVPRRLVGTDGKVLEALQELTRLAVQAATGDRSRLMLDVAGHRAGRREAVLEEARAAIAKVRDGADKVALAPMTAFERKVAHDEILAAGLVSESDGVEPRRFVVVYPS